MDKARTRASRPQTLRATLIGGSAVLMWSTLALLTVGTGEAPPFQLVAMAFSVATLIGVGLWVRQGGPWLRHLRLPWPVWVNGVVGLFGYHFFYFLALDHAPAVEANLINYLWPLLIVLFSALLPGERLRWFHAAGALLGMIGAVLLILRGGRLELDLRYVGGYGAALVAAVLWASYSVISRRFGSIPTQAVGGFCGVTAILATLAHLAFETTVWPTGWAWLAVLGLGLGPVGVAFFTWDMGVKHGNIRALGALAYATPLLSTLLLISFGLAEPTWSVLAACGLIVGGAVLAAGDLF